MNENNKQKISRLDRYISGIYSSNRRNAYSGRERSFWVDLAGYAALSIGLVVLAVNYFVDEILEK